MRGFVRRYKIVKGRWEVLRSGDFLFNADLGTQTAEIGVDEV